MKPLLLVISVLIFFIVFQSCKTTIDTTKYPTPTFSSSEYPVDKEVKLSLSIIETGYAETRESFVFKGGKFSKKRKLSHVSVLIQHPKGTFVFDTGLGSGVKEQFHDNTSFINRQLFKFTKTKSLKETLINNEFSLDSIDFIIPTHLHFDHASGIEDLPNATVWITQEEFEHAFSEEANPPAFIKEQYDAEFIDWNIMDFSNTAYEVFNESYDVFNDGTVVLVKLPGHTKGSIGMFVNLQSGKRYFFTGDLTWAAEAFSIPAEKHAIPSKKVDGDREKVKETIVLVHHLKNTKSNIILVPAHDYNVQKNIAHFPDVER